MAKRSFSAHVLTFTATSDSTRPANDTFMAINAGGANERLVVDEIYWAGLATTSAVSLIHFCRVVDAGTTTTALASPVSDGPIDGAGYTLTSPTGAYTKCTTNPVSSIAATDARLELGGNAFGGIVKWNPAPGYSWCINGNTTQTSMLRATNLGSGGSPTVTAHILYERL